MTTTNTDPLNVLTKKQPIPDVRMPRIRTTTPVTLERIAGKLLANSTCMLRPPLLPYLRCVAGVLQRHCIQQPTTATTVSTPTVTMVVI